MSRKILNTKQMKESKSLQITLAFILFASMTSCMTTKTNVGAYRESQGSTYTYAKGKQIWLFWNILPLGRTSVSTPTNGSCQVITRFNLVDCLVTGLTGGLVSMETVKVVAKK